MDDLYKERTWGSIDSSSDSDYADMPDLICDDSDNASDNDCTVTRPIARKKKVVLQLSGGKSVLISSAGDDNESMSKLFATNLKLATDELAPKDNVAMRLAENIAELKIAMLRTCTGYAKYFDESSACNAEPRIEHMMEQLNHATNGDAATYVSSAFDAKKACYTGCSGRTWLRSALLGSRRPDLATLSCTCTNAATWLTGSPRIAIRR